MTETKHAVLLTSEERDKLVQTMNAALAQVQKDEEEIERLRARVVELEGACNVAFARVHELAVRIAPRTAPIISEAHEALYKVLAKAEGKP